MQKQGQLTLTNRLMKQIYTLLILIKLQSRTALKQPMLFFSMFFLPLILLFGLGVMIPSNSMLVASFGLVPTLISGIIFGNLFYNIDGTTFKDNSSLSNVGKKSRLISVGVTTFLFTFLSTLIELLIFVLFDSNDWFFRNYFVIFGPKNYESVEVVWSNIPWGNLIYYIIGNITMSIILWSFMKRFFPGEKEFSIFVLVYFLFVLFFGGTLMMNYHTNRTWAMDDTYINSKQWLAGKQSTWEFNSWYQYTMFITPNYFVNQQFASLLRVGSRQTNGIYWWDAAGFHFVTDDNSPKWALDIQKQIDLVTASGTQLLNDDTLIGMYNTTIRSLNINTSFWDFNGDPTFTATVILPYVYMVVLGLFSIISKK